MHARNSVVGFRNRLAIQTASFSRLVSDLAGLFRATITPPQSNSVPPEPVATGKLRADTSTSYSPLQAMCLPYDFLFCATQRLTATYRCEKAPTGGALWGFVRLTATY